ncbi:MAG: hypothetical protein II319_05025 [Clostridia bacterium]|nr:hypothetical protein [Clostridia bacterium]
MKDYETIIKTLKLCTDLSKDCDNCPYADEPDACKRVKIDAVKLLEEMKAALEQPTTAGAECAVMPNYEEINRKLEEKLCEAEIDHERAQRSLYEAQEELAYLRAVKATAEAFLGRKIEVI